MHSAAGCHAPSRPSRWQPCPLPGAQVGAEEPKRGTQVLEGIPADPKKTSFGVTHLAPCPPLLQNRPKRPWLAMNLRKMTSPDTRGLLFLCLTIWGYPSFPAKSSRNKGTCKRDSTIAAFRLPILWAQTRLRSGNGTDTSCVHRFIAGLSPLGIAENCASPKIIGWPSRKQHAFPGRRKHVFPVVLSELWTHNCLKLITWRASSPSNLHSKSQRMLVTKPQAKVKWLV